MQDINYFNNINRYSATCIKDNDIESKVQARYVEIVVNVNIVAKIVM